MTSVHSNEENQFINNLVGSRPTTDIGRFWIGGRIVGGSWGWSDGSPWAYLNWRSGEPNDKVRVNVGEFSEDCIEMLQSTQWNDRWCGTKRYFVCKKTL